LNKSTEKEKRRKIMGNLKNVKEKYLIFLDKLQESGTTNMYGAGSYLQDEFGMSREESREVLKHWMKTYSERHPK